MPVKDTIIAEQNKKNRVNNHDQLKYSPKPVTVGKLSFMQVSFKNSVLLYDFNFYLRLDFKLISLNLYNI